MLYNGKEQLAVRKRLAAEKTATILNFSTYKKHNARNARTVIDR